MIFTVHYSLIRVLVHGHTIKVCMVHPLRRIINIYMVPLLRKII